MTRADQVIAESGVAVEESDRSNLSRQATRRVNMTGWRFSDALRAELRDYGADAAKWRRNAAEGDRVAATLGYR